MLDKSLNAESSSQRSFAFHLDIFECCSVEFSSETDCFGKSFCMISGKLRSQRQWELALQHSLPASAHPDSHRCLVKMRSLGHERTPERTPERTRDLVSLHGEGQERIWNSALDTFKVRLVKALGHTKCRSYHMFTLKLAASLYRILGNIRALHPQSPSGTLLPGRVLQLLFPSMRCGAASSRPSNHDAETKRLICQCVTDSPAVRPAASLPQLGSTAPAVRSDSAGWGISSPLIPMSQVWLRWLHGPQIHEKRFGEGIWQDTSPVTFLESRMKGFRPSRDNLGLKR